jgi:hypothetical protein
MLGVSSADEASLVYLEMFAARDLMFGLLYWAANARK